MWNFWFKRQLLQYALQYLPTSHTAQSPSQLVFGMDMVMQQPINVDWNKLKQQRTQQAIANNAKENKNRLEHEYKVGDQ
jgi:hypothetical protein